MLQIKTLARAFFSRIKKYFIIYILKKILAEFNYNIYNKELLAIVAVFKK